MSTTRQEKGSTRDKILQTALKLFADRGYFSTSIHDIRRVAELSIGSIYHHFAAKEAIADALYRQLVESISEDLRLATTGLRTYPEHYKAIIRTLFERCETDPDCMRFILHARHQEFLPDEPPICSSQPFEFMKRLVEEGLASGDIRPMQSIVAAAALFGGPIRLMHLRLDKVLESSLPELLEESWECAWSAVKA